jgi:hypothetical protein
MSLVSRSSCSCSPPAHFPSCRPLVRPRLSGQGWSGPGMRLSPGATVIPIDRVSGKSHASESWLPVRPVQCRDMVVRMFDREQRLSPVL